MRITSKGQVTIPKAIREKLGVGPGSNVGFAEDGDKIVLTGMENEENANAGVKLVKHLQEMGRKAKRIPMTSEELMELTRGPFNDLDPD
ncbi:MAG: AbrB/MazE/SpoVT family DNA-binding domain-containing protein [Aestuariivirga sp.]